MRKLGDLWNRMWVSNWTFLCGPWPIWPNLTLDSTTRLVSFTDGETDSAGSSEAFKWQAGIWTASKLYHPVCHCYSFFFFKAFVSFHCKSLSLKAFPAVVKKQRRRLVGKEVFLGQQVCWCARSCSLEDVSGLTLNRRVCFCPAIWVQLISQQKSVEWKSSSL